MNRIKVILILIVAAFFCINAQSAVNKVFPKEGAIYMSEIDTGYLQYETPSLKGSRQLVLTFDDGPHPEYTAKILDVLKEFNVKVTFFILGENVNSKTLPTIERILKEGHFLASHDYNHLNKNSVSEVDYKAGLEKSIRLIESLENRFGITQKEMFYRFPYADYGKNKNYHHLNIVKEISHKLYEENCINFVFWEIDSADWISDMSSEDVAEGVIAQIEGGIAYKHQKKNGKWVKHAYSIVESYGGGIVLMHDIHKKNIESVRLILNYAKKNSIEVIPLNQVEGYNYLQLNCELKK